MITFSAVEGRQGQDKTRKTRRQKRIAWNLAKDPMEMFTLHTAGVILCPYFGNVLNNE